MWVYGKHMQYQFNDGTRKNILKSVNPVYDYLIIESSVMPGSRNALINEQWFKLGFQI